MSPSSSYCYKISIVPSLPIDFAFCKLATNISPARDPDINYTSLQNVFGNYKKSNTAYAEFLQDNSPSDHTDSSILVLSLGGKTRPEDEHTKVLKIWLIIAWSIMP